MLLLAWTHRPDSRAAAHRRITRSRRSERRHTRHGKWFALSFCLRLGVRARDRLLPTESIGGRRHYGQTRHGRVRSSPLSGLHDFAWVRMSSSFLIEPPLMRFGPLQHSLAAMRCPGLGFASLPASGRSRFGVLISSARATACGPALTNHSPLRFFATGGAKRRRSIWRTLLCWFTPFMQHVAFAFAAMSISRRNCLSIVRAERFRGNRKSRSRRSGHSNASALIRLPSRVMRRAVLRHGVPLPARLLMTILAHLVAALGFVEPRSGLHGLAERLVLPSIVRRRSWGSTLRRFAPASGGIASLRLRAHVPFAPLARPD
jgi:hypothetical protein